MFKKKNDPLVESVKAVMKENEFRRQAEAALNEELGISSKKALPHEYHEAYDRLLNEKVKPDQYSHKQKKLAMLGNAAGKGGNPKKIDEPDLNAARKGHAHKVGLEEKLTKKMSAGDIISDFVRSKDPKFKGKSKEERQKMALGAYYGMHPEKSRKMDEAEGDVNPNDMPKPSKGLQDRIVKDPPAPTPAPAPKKMEEGVAMDRASAAGKMAYGTIKQPRTRIGAEQKEPNKVTVGVMKSFLRRQEKKKENVAESVIDEIRRNLEENLMAIHESGDEELFENYVNSLTEEELDILGLNEAEPGFIGRALNTIGIKTPQVRSQEAEREAIGSMAGPSQKATENQPQLAPQSIPNTPDSKSPVTGQVSRPLPPANPNTDAPVAGVGKTPKADAPSEEPGAQTKPMPATATPARPAPAPRPATPAARPQPQQRQRPSTPAMGSHTPFGAYGGSAGPLSLEESVKPQIKESLESFLKNRFLKG